MVEGFAYSMEEVRKTEGSLLLLTCQMTIEVATSPADWTNGRARRPTVLPGICVERVRCRGFIVSQTLRGLLV